MRLYTKLPVYLFGLFILVGMSCNRHREKDAVTLDSIRPHSKQKKDQNNSSKQPDTLSKYVNYYANDSAALQIASLMLDSSNGLHFMDRFSTNRRKWILQDSNEVVFHYKQWLFKDSSACLEAFYNWLDQAGWQKESVKLLEGSIFGARHQLIIVADKELLFIEAPRHINFNKWLLWYRGTDPDKRILYALYSQPKKRTKWFKYTNNKMTAL
jgi:hypothetical protein